MGVTNNPSPRPPNLTTNIDLYSCFGDLETRPEVAYIFTPTQSGNYKVDLTNMAGADCDLIVLAGGNCNGTCATSTSFSANHGPWHADESVTFAAQAGQSYYIVVDSTMSCCYCSANLSLANVP